MAIAAHIAAVVLLFQHQPTRVAISEAVPIMVNFIAPPRPAEAVRHPPAPRPVQRKPEARPSAPAPRILTSAADAPVTAVAPAPAPVPQPAPSPVAAGPAAPVAAVPAPPVPIVQPSYNADYLQNPAPRYPPLARRMGQQGKVVLRVLVNAGGTAAQVEVRASSGSELLDAAALEAVRQWRFAPARRGDEPVAAWVLVPITFTLQG